MAEILKLPLNPVGPLNTMKEVVTKPVDDYQAAGKRLCLVDRSARDEGLHEGSVVATAQIEMLEGEREILAVVVSLAKVPDRPPEGCQI